MNQVNLFGRIDLKIEVMKNIRQLGLNHLSTKSNKHGDKKLTA